MAILAFTAQNNVRNRANERVPLLPTQDDDDVALARALAASLEDVQQTAHSSSAHASGSNPKEAESEPDDPSIILCLTIPGLNDKCPYLLPDAAGRGVSGAAAPISVPLPDGSYVTRRIIDSDNSCLFNAVGESSEPSDALLHVCEREPPQRTVVQKHALPAWRG